MIKDEFVYFNDVVNKPRMWEALDKRPRKIWLGYKPCGNESWFIDHVIGNEYRTSFNDGLKYRGRAMHSIYALSGHTVHSGNSYGVPYIINCCDDSVSLIDFSQAQIGEKISSATLNEMKKIKDLKVQFSDIVDNVELLNLMNLIHQNTSARFAVIDAEIPICEHRVQYRYATPVKVIISEPNNHIAWAVLTTVGNVNYIFDTETAFYIAAPNFNKLFQRDFNEVFQRELSLHKIICNEKPLQGS